ncbi:hypothetical protein PIB30_091108, partial [Stylosanthes scabra]|nr:hypothetical protein [Stylosanthes scabra]
MALIPSSQSTKIKNGLIPLSNKLDENNFFTWRKSVLPTIRTLKLQGHLDPSQTPPQFEEIESSDEKDADSSTKKPKDVETESGSTLKKTKSPTIIQESDKYTEWVQHDSALMTC